MVESGFTIEVEVRNVPESSTGGGCANTSGGAAGAGSCASTGTAMADAGGTPCFGNNSFRSASARGRVSDATPSDTYKRTDSQLRIYRV
jgi:hypothetical protein